MKKLEKNNERIPLTIESYACSCGVHCNCDPTCSCTVFFVHDPNLSSILNAHESEYLADQSANNYRK